MMCTRKEEEEASGEALRGNRGTCVAGSSIRSYGARLADQRLRYPTCSGRRDTRAGGIPYPVSMTCGLCAARSMQAPAATQGYTIPKVILPEGCVYVCSSERCVRGCVRQYTSSRLTSASQVGPAEVEGGCEGSGVGPQRQKSHGCEVAGRSDIKWRAGDVRWGGVRVCRVGSVNRDSSMGVSPVRRLRRRWAPSALGAEAPSPPACSGGEDASCG